MCYSLHMVMSRFPVSSANTRFDELNLAQASLISFQKRLKPGETGWEHAFEIAGRPMNVECLGNSYGYPHGPDNDLMLMLTNLYLEQGCPAGDWVVTTPYELLKSMGRNDSGRSYQILHDGLMRLTGTTYRISGWIDQHGQGTRRATFRFVEQVEDINLEGATLNPSTFGKGTKLRVTLARDIAANLRSRHLKPVDLDFMLSLPTNQAGILYRLLDAMLFSNPEAQRTQRLSLSVVEWGRLLRLSDLSPDRIRRAIDPPHQELIRREFLNAVEYLGRGTTQQVVYTFNAQRPDHPLSPEQLLLVGRIKAMGVTDGVAKKFVRASPVSFVENRVRIAEAVLAQTTSFKRSKGAYAWDILSDTGDRYTPPESHRSLRLPKSGMRPSTIDEQTPTLPDENDQGVLLELTPPEQWKSARASLRLLLKGHLSEAEFQVLEQQCIQGQRRASRLFRDVSAATAQARLDALVASLKLELTQKVL
jgi:plasmid replication initiation protein